MKHIFRLFIAVLCFAGISVMVSCDYSDTKTKTTYGDLEYNPEDYATVENPAPTTGEIYAFDTVIPADDFQADDWVTGDVTWNNSPDPDQDTAYDGSSIITDGAHTCMKTDFHHGDHWESMIVYVKKYANGTAVPMNFSEAASISFDIKGSWTDVEGSITFALKMVNGAEYQYSCAVTDSWATVVIPMPVEGAVLNSTTETLNDPTTGAPTGWKWANWTSPDTFTHAKIAHIGIFLSPTENVPPPTGGNSYWVCLDNLKVIAK